MPRLIYTAASLSDVARLEAFLRRKDPDAARRVARAIRQSLDALAHRPHIGRPAGGLASEFREWPIPFGQQGYVALYRFDGKETVVLAVRHWREAGY